MTKKLSKSAAAKFERELAEAADLAEQEIVKAAKATSKAASEKVEKGVGKAAAILAILPFILIFTVTWGMKIVLGFIVLLLVGIFIVSLQSDDTQAKIFSILPWKK